MATKRRKSQTQKAASKGNVSHGLKPSDLPDRPGGGSWPYQMWRAAQLRAEGKAWSEVCATLEEEIKGRPPKLNTLQSYSKKPGFAELVIWFEDREITIKRRLWFKEDERRIADGIAQVTEALIKIATGQPLGEGRLPTPMESLLAGAEYLRAVGYQEARKLIASERAATLLDEQGSGGGQKDEDTKLVIDIGIH